MAKDKKTKTGKKAARSPQPQAGDGPQPKMTTKAYEKEMRRLQGELVALQDWVITTGAKVCIVFEVERSSCFLGGPGMSSGSCLLR